MNQTKVLVIITVVGFIGVLAVIALSPLWMPGATLTGAILLDVSIIAGTLGTIFSTWFYRWLLDKD
jgi:hypothetical protein